MRFYPVLSYVTYTATITSCLLYFSLLSGSSRGIGDRSDVEPAQQWTGHSLPVNDMYVSSGGLSARVYTASKDRTVKVQTPTCSVS